MSKKMETRRLEEIRVAKGEKGDVIEGYAVKWDSPSRDLGGFVEEFERGAFTETIIEDDIRVQWQHDPRYVFGRMKAGTAEVWEDDVGLGFRAYPPDAQWARDAIESIRRGDVDQNSFKFGVKPNGERWSHRDGMRIRTIVSAYLREVGPQTEPAYEDTEVALRSMADWEAESEPDVIPFDSDPESVKRKRRSERRPD